MAVEVGYGHVVLNSENVPVIAGTKTKVVELVLDHLAYGWSAEELHFQHPHLSMAQIHSALAYYWDHREELDADIERRRERVDEIRAATPPSELAKRLRSSKPA